MCVYGGGLGYAEIFVGGSWKVFEGVSRTCSGLKNPLIRLRMRVNVLFIGP